MHGFTQINGKRVPITSQGATVADLPGIRPTDVVMKRDKGRFTPVDRTQPVRDKDVYAAVPQVTKGAGVAGPSSWVSQDLDLLRSALGNGSPVGSKPIERAGKRYTAVEIDQVRLSDQKFGRTYGKMLFLLPHEYPAMPPIGLYLNYPHGSKQAADHHFTLQSHYGAPDLQQAGWYWYCIQPMNGGAWRPQADPADGHNLVALFAAATHAINS